MAEEEKIEDWVKGLDNISNSMRDVSRLQTGIIKGFTDITKTSTATGQAWVATARFFSGTGFWKIQNKIKSISNMLQAAQVIEKKRNEQEQAMLEETIKREDALKNIRRVETALSKIKGGNVDSTSRQLIFQSKYFKMLQMTVGTTAALALMEKRMGKAKLKIQQSEKEHGYLLIKEYKKRLKNETGLLIERKKFLKLSKDEQAQVAKLESLKEEKKIIRDTKGGNKEEKEIRAERLEEIKQLEADIVEELGKVGFDFQISMNKKKTPRGAFGGRATKTIGGTSTYDKDVSGVAKKGDNVAAASLRRKEGDAGGRDSELVSVKIDDASLEKMSWWEKETLKWQKRADRINEVREKIKEKRGQMLDAIKNVGLKGIFVMFKGFLKKSLFLFGKLFLFITLFIMGYFLLKKLGIFKYIQTVFNGIVLTIGFIVSFISDLIQAFSVAWAATENLFDNIFSGSAWMDFFKAFGELAYQLLFGLWETVLWPALYNIAILPLYEWGLSIMNKILGFFGLKSDHILVGIAGIALILVAIKAIVALLPLIIAAMPAIIIGGIAIAIVAAIATGIGKLFGAAAEGGPVKGLTIVGEKGPELINAPSGSRVYSNANSRKMVGAGTTNNITVNVQGRIGASDAEVRDMATKVSKIISREINRSTSSGTRG